MDSLLLDEAIELLEKANADLEPELLASSDARELLQRYARVERLGAFGVAALARKIDDAATISRVTGTSMGAAKATVATGKVLRESGELSAAFQAGEVSLDQAAEIAKAEESSPGAAKELLPVARSSGFHVLRDKARAIKLDAEQHRDLGHRQHEARSARSYADDFGMLHVHLAFEPHVGTPIVARAEADAQRLGRAAKKEGREEPFERLLADAYGALLSGSGKGRAKRPELVFLVSAEIPERGWTEVKPGEVCKIPGVGPVSPQVVKELARDAIISAVIYDGKDLRHLARWSRNIPIEVQIALELGDPPEFDGVKCVDCGNRFRTEFDHIEPHVALGPASRGNLDPRCRSCHLVKTEQDRKDGKLRPPDP